MRAYITSIGEKTTELCKWSLERNGFEVILVEGLTTLQEKLKFIYNDTNEDFVRVDADVIPNRNLTPDIKTDNWWTQFQMFEWFRQDVGWGGVQFIKKEALPALRANVDQFKWHDRPETELSRIPEFHNPRRFASDPTIMGVHNYKNDIKRVSKVKANRGQSHLFDWALVERINEL